MIILDSSAWLEYFAGSKYSESIVEFAENPEILIVPSITLYEVFKVINKQFSVSEAEKSTEFMSLGKIIGLNKDIAIAADKISIQKSIPMADSIIYATGKIYEAKIYTFDYDFNNLDNVEILIKHD